MIINIRNGVQKGRRARCFWFLNKFFKKIFLNCKRYFGDILYIFFFQLFVIIENFNFVKTLLGMNSLFNVYNIKYFIVMHNLEIA